MERLTYSAYGLQRITFDDGNIVVRLSPETSAALAAIDAKRSSVEDMARAGLWEVRIRGKRIPCPKCDSAGCKQCGKRGWIRGEAWIDLAEWIVHREKHKRIETRTRRKNDLSIGNRRADRKAPRQNLEALRARFEAIELEYGQAAMIAGEGETANPRETSELNSIPSLTIDDSELAELLVSALSRSSKAIRDNVTSFGHTGKGGENDE